MNLIKHFNRNFISEMAYALGKDYDFGDNLEILKSQFKRHNHLAKEFDTFTINNQTYTIYLFNSNLYTVDEDNNFVNAISITLVNLKPKLARFFGEQVISICAMQTDIRHRRKGIAKEVIKSLLNKGYCVMGDRIEYENARRLWASLSNLTDYTLDIINIGDDCYIARKKRIKNILDEDLWVLYDHPEHAPSTIIQLGNSKILNTRSIIYKK